MKMNGQIKYSKGSLTGTILPLLILTVIAGIGWYLYYDEHKSNQAFNLTNQIERKDLDTDLERSQANIDVLESRQRELDDQNKSLTEQIDKHQQGTDSLNKRISQLEISLTELRKEHDVVQGRNAMLETALAEEQNKIQLVMTNTARLENDMQQMIDEVSVKSRELKKELEQRQKQQVSLSSQIDSVSEEKQALLHRLQDEQRSRLQFQNQVTQVNQDIVSKSEALTDAAQGLKQLQATLDEIRAQKDREAAEFATLKKQLEQELNQTQVQVTQLENQMRVINLSSEVLFNSGSAEIKPAGQKILALIASTLNNYPNREIFIEGHTDDIPMGENSIYRSNWELSSARAISAVEILQENNQVSPERLKVVGHGEFKPVTSNETAEGRRLNRRIEIRLLPETAGLSG